MAPHRHELHIVGDTMTLTMPADSVGRDRDKIVKALLALAEVVDYGSGEVHVTVEYTA